MRHSHSLPAGRWPWAAAACPDQATTMTPASTSTAPPARRGVRGICWARKRPKLSTSSPMSSCPSTGRITVSALPSLVSRMTLAVRKTTPHRPPSQTQKGSPASWSMGRWKPCPVTSSRQARKTVEMIKDTREEL